MLSRTFTVSFPATGGAVPVKRRETYDYAALAAGEVSRPFKRQSARLIVGERDPNGKWITFTPK